MPVGDKDVALRGNDYARRPVESVRAVAGYAWLPQGQQNRSGAVELYDDVAFRAGPVSIGRPHIPIGIDKKGVGKNKHSRAKTPDQFAGLIEFQNGRLAAAFAGICATPLKNPDVACRVGGDRRYRAELSRLRGVRPVREYLKRAGNRSLRLDWCDGNHRHPDEHAFDHASTAAR